MAIKLHINKELPYSITAIKSLILDLENYESFIKWCKVKVESKTEDEILTNVKIDLHPFSYKFNCVVEENSQDFTTVIRIYGSKILQFTFSAHWLLHQISPWRTSVEFKINLDLVTTLLDKKVQTIAEKYTKKIMNLFEEELMRRNIK